MFGELLIDNKYIYGDKEILPLVHKDSEINALLREEQYEQAIEDLYINEGLSAESVKEMPLKFKTVIMKYSTLNLTPSQFQTNKIDVDCKYKQAILEYKLVKSDETNRWKHCCCSKPIRVLYYMVNQYNYNILLVGSECIKKFYKEYNKDDTLRLNKYIKPCKLCGIPKRYDKLISGYCNDCIHNKYLFDFSIDLNRACHYCFKFKININNSKSVMYCKQCSVKYMRECGKCNELIISKKESLDVKYCTDCIKYLKECVNCCQLEELNSESYCSYCLVRLYRACKKCNKLTILKDEPNEINYCANCRIYLKECINCHQLTIISSGTHCLNCIKYLKECINCHQLTIISSGTHCSTCVKKLYRQCVNCHKLVIPANEMDTVVKCSTCINIENTFKKCIKCNQLNIPKYRNTDIYCTYCYEDVKIIANTAMRDCHSCLEPRIPKSYPENLKYCSVCCNK